LKNLTFGQFLRLIKTKNQIDYLFLLGAGASQESNIPTAEELIEMWKREIYISENIEKPNEFLTSEHIQKWLDEQKTNPPNKSIEEYAHYAESCLVDEGSRRAFFENTFIDKEPSNGYRVLCLLIEYGLTKTILTTNFDRLIMKASQSANIECREITSESADQIALPMHKKFFQCIALHGDYRYSRLKNTSKELEFQNNYFSSFFVNQLYQKDLIVIGYSGRDKSLMDILERAYNEPGCGSIYWLSYHEPSENIKYILSKIDEQRLGKESNEQRNIYIVETDGFDDAILKIAKYLFSENDLFMSKLNGIQVINDISISDEEILVEPVLEKKNMALKKTKVEIPIYSEPKIDNETINVLLFIGKWNDNNEADKEVITQFTRINYNRIIQEIRDYSVKNGVILFNNGIWKIDNRKSFWEENTSTIFNSHLDNIIIYIESVLSEINPKFDLPKEERFSAGFYDKQLQYSEELRTGLTETLVLLSMQSEKLINCTRQKAEIIVDSTVRNIFKNKDWKIWASLNDLLPILAEAAPETFLTVVEDSIRNSDNPFISLFHQEGDGITGWNYMTGLLWALESLAWNPEYLSRVALILCHLVVIDPGGNWVNRPKNSLITIFLPWFPQTMATVDKRILSLKTVAKIFPEITWNILIQLLPNHHQTTSGSQKPKWREYIPADLEIKVSGKEYWEQVNAYARLIVELAKQYPNCRNELIGNLESIPDDSFHGFMEYLKSDDIITLPEEMKLSIWESLRALSNKHRRFSDAKWVFPAEKIKEIKDVAEKLESKDARFAYRYLFTDSGFELYEKNADWSEQDKEIEQRRQKSLQKIIDDFGESALLELIDKVGSSSRLGWSLGAIGNEKIDNILLPRYIDKKGDEYSRFTSNYISSRYHNQGIDWINSYKENDWDLSSRNTFLSYLPFSMEIWQVLHEWLGENENDYWKQVHVRPFQTEVNAYYAVDKLLLVRRPIAAIDCLNSYYFNYKEIDKERVVKALRSAIDSEENPDQMFSHNVIEFIKLLQDEKELFQDDLVKIEWAYLPLLDRYNQAEPKVLERKLSTEPEFFCKIIQNLYKSKNKDFKPSISSDEIKRIAPNAWKLLNDWKRPPGFLDDGLFSEKILLDWFEKVKSICIETGHLDIALQKVGEVLFYSPNDPGGLWIHKGVANIIDTFEHIEIRRGYYLKVRNSRGVHSIDPSGKPEEDLAKVWATKANEIENEGFINFATELKNIAKSYEMEAEQIRTRFGEEDD